MFSIPKYLIKLYFSIALIAGILFAVAELFIDSGLNLKEFDVLNTSSSVFSMAGDNSSQHQLETQRRPVILRCEAVQGTESICGIKIELSDEKQKTPYTSLISYDHILLEAKISSSNSNYDGRLRVSILTAANNAKQNTQEPLPAKSQSIRIKSAGYHYIPLDEFKVDVWWLDKYGVSVNDSKVDLSQANAIEILVNQLPIRDPGEYTIELGRLNFQGKVIPQKLLWYVMGVLVPLIFVIFIIHAFWFVGKSVKGGTEKSIDNEKLYLDMETGFFNRNGLLKDYEKIVEEGNTSHLYYFQLNNYEQLKKIIGNGAALLVLKNHWLFFMQRLDRVPLTIYRIGESEFVVNSVASKLSDNEIKYALIRPDNDSFMLDKTIVFIPKHYQTPTVDLFIERCQVTAQYSREHDDHYTEFSLGHFHKYEEEIYIKQCLRAVLSTNEFYLQYMPYFNSESNRIVGAEALLRSSAPSLYRYSPEVYVKVAEQHGLIQQIDLWVIKEAFITLQKYQSQLIDDFILSINISSRQMLDHTFVDELRKLLQQYKVNPGYIRLELKEDFFVNIEELEATNLVEIKKLGFSIGLDNFGTGYTAFENLSRIPADQIKIDQSYVSNLNDKTTNVVVSSLINIAKAFNYQLSAEGIETQEQMKQLVDMGCEVFQGFYISEPISFEDILNFNVGQVEEKVQ